MLQLSLGNVQKHSRHRQILQHLQSHDAVGDDPARLPGEEQAQPAQSKRSLIALTQSFHPKQPYASPFFWRFWNVYDGFVAAHQDDPESLVNKPIALTLLAMVVFPSILFVMTQTKRPYVSAFTWFVIDNSCATLFAAVLVDIAELGIHEIQSLELRLIVAMLHSIFVLSGAVTLAWILRADRQSLVTCCNCSVYVVSFAFAHAANVSQAAFFSSAYFLCFLGIFAIMLVQLILAVLLYQTKRLLGLRRGSPLEVGPKSWGERIPLYQARRMNGHENRFESSDSHAVEWVELVEDVENDYAAIALGAVVSKSIYFVIVGAYPGLDSDSQFFERSNAFLAFGGVLVLVSILCLLYGSIFHRPDTQYLTRRSGNFCVSLVVMCAVWTLHDEAIMEVGEHTIFAYPVLVYLGISAASLIVTLLSIFVIAWWSTVADDKFGRWVALQALSLMLGLSISQGINAAVEVLLPSLCSRIFLLLVLDILILLVYVAYLKPITIDKEIITIDKEIIYY